MLGLMGSDICKFPSNSTCLGIESNRQSPHYTCSTMVAKRTVIVNNLSWYASRCIYAFDVVVQIKIIIISIKSRFPFCGKQYQNNIVKLAELK